MRTHRYTYILGRRYKGFSDLQLPSDLKKMTNFFCSSNNCGAGFDTILIDTKVIWWAKIKSLYPLPSNVLYIRHCRHIYCKVSIYLLFIHILTCITIINHGFSSFSLPIWQSGRYAQTPTDRSTTETWPGLHHAATAVTAPCPDMVARCH